jgi:hypothetical protein
LKPYADASNTLLKARSTTNNLSTPFAFNIGRNYSPR